VQSVESVSKYFLYIRHVQGAGKSLDFGAENRSRMALVGKSEGKKEQKKTCGAEFSSAGEKIHRLDHYLRKFFLPATAKPIRPKPKRSMVAGSGTGVPVPTIET